MQDDVDTANAFEQLAEQGPLLQRMRALVASQEPTFSRKRSPDVTFKACTEEPIIGVVNVTRGNQYFPMGMLY